MTILGVFLARRLPGLGFFAAPLVALVFLVLSKDLEHLHSTRKDLVLQHAVTRSANHLQQKRRFGEEVNVEMRKEKSGSWDAEEGDDGAAEEGQRERPVEGTVPQKATAVDAEDDDNKGDGPPHRKNPSSSSIVNATTSFQPRPPLSELIDSEGNVLTDDLQWLLDFSIVGFGKCGTSTMMEWLHRHPDLQCIQEEVWALSKGKPKGLIARLYRDLPMDTSTQTYKRGYKCPADISDLRVLNYYRKYWPKTKLFVGVR